MAEIPFLFDTLDYSDFQAFLVGCVFFSALILFRIFDENNNETK